MRPFLSLAGVLLLLTTVSAAEPHPLRFVPPQANLVVRIEKPRQLAETATGLDLVKQMQALPFVREQLQSPTIQRILQLIEYYEKDLGAPWPELLDRLAGKGITFAAKVGGDNAPVLLVIDGTDAGTNGKFVQLAVSLLEQELARQESKDKLEKCDYRGLPGWRMGDFRIAQVGPTLLVSNKMEAMKLALDLHLDGGKSLADSAGPNAARKALPANCMAWLWLDLDVARKAPNAKETFAQPSNDVVQTVAIGAWVDVVRRAGFLAAGLYREGDAFRLTLRFPGGGRDGMSEALALHVPPAGQAGTLPPLEPKGVIFSHSFYFDFKALWELRGKIFNEKIAKDFEAGVKKVAPFIPNSSLEKLFLQSGPTHRFVVAHQPKVGYGVKPKQYLPNFAVVTTMRDPQFAKTVEGILRAVALFAGGEYKPKLVDELHAGVKIVGYRFPEDRSVADDPNDQRFNFSPCFATVGNQFLACSTIEFAREIVDLLAIEALSKFAADPSPLQSRLYGSGGVKLLQAYEEQVLGQIVLDQAVKPDEGRKQMDALMAWVNRLGQLELRSTYEQNQYRFDIEWRPK